MGVVSSKSSLERRNTVLRRSQRKSVFGVKSKVDKLVKDIKKLKGTDGSGLLARIEGLERDLNLHKNVQPQIRQIYSETLKKTQELYRMLEQKLEENEKKEATKEAEVPKENDVVEEQRKDDDLDDDVFVEEITEETPQKNNVAIKIIQVKAITESPQLNKRQSIVKMGVPVMPVSMMESLQRKNVKAEDLIVKIRASIEDLEAEINNFVGRVNGKYYTKIKEQLNRHSSNLISINTSDEAIKEQIKLCHNYINSCLSFLDEKATNGPPSASSEDTATSPRSIRTTYI